MVLIFSKKRNVTLFSDLLLWTSLFCGVTSQLRLSRFYQRKDGYALGPHVPSTAESGIRIFVCFVPVEKGSISLTYNDRIHTIAAIWISCKAFVDIGCIAYSVL